MRKIKKKVMSVCILLLLSIFVLLNIFDIKNMLLKIIYPQKYMEEITKYSNEFNIDPFLILSIIKVESNFSSDAKSTSNAIGLMQIMKDTAVELNKQLNQKDNYEGEYKINIEENDLYDVNRNIRLGTYYISNLIKKYRKYWNCLNSI